MSTDRKDEKDRTVHIAVGFFFFINYCIGTGFLSIPYAFAYSGYLAAIPTITFITFATWIGSNYVLEVLARAQVSLVCCLYLLYINIDCINVQALKYYEQSNEKANSDFSDSDKDSAEEELYKSLTPDLITHHPKFEITQRKFEILDLCEIFFHRYVKYGYFLAQTAFMFAGIWSDATVAGTAWATKIPFHYLSSYLTCSDNAFLHHIRPSGGCLYAYYLSIILYACIVITLSLLDLKEQAIFQIIFGLMRFFTIALIVLYCVVRLIQGGDACSDYEYDNNYTSSNVDISSVALKFNVSSWLQSIPIFAFGYMFLTGIPSFIHPIRQKDSLHWLLVTVIMTVLSSYLLTGIAISLWFRAAIQENCTLNWVSH